MAVTIILGGQWGDEGKGKLVDIFAERADMVIRANGGANAGHTVVTDQGTFKFHLIPSGILRPDCRCIIGAGVVLDPELLLQELQELRDRGVDTSNLRVSSRSHIVMPYHPIFDRLEEEMRGDSKIGTTQRGMGPAYADKAARVGLRIADIADPEHLYERLEAVLEEKNHLLASRFGHPPLELAPMAEQYAAFGEALTSYIADTELMVQDAIDAGVEVLIEGAQAVMLDIDYGSYPYVTSSSPTAAGVCQGAAVAPTQVDRVVGVYKAYATRVGEGAFPTELNDSIGVHIRERGQEYGTTTGRPRRTGWFDAVQARFTARLNGVGEIALTKFDVLDELDSVLVCTGYQLDGVAIQHPPPRISDYARVEPIFEEWPGWGEDTTRAESADDLPVRARQYVNRIEELVGVPVTYVGVGPHRRQMVTRVASAA